MTEILVIHPAIPAFGGRRKYIIQNQLYPLESFCLVLKLIDFQAMFNYLRMKRMLRTPA